MALGPALLADVMRRVFSSEREGRGSLRAASAAFFRAPIKGIAVFLTAPYLAYQIARFAKTAGRRRIAAVGLVLSVLAAWLIGTAAGIGVTALFLAAHIGFFYGVAFWLGATFSFTFSVVLSLVALNATAALFVGLSNEEVLDHLERLAG